MCVFCWDTGQAVAEADKPHAINNLMAIDLVPICPGRGTALSRNQQSIPILPYNRIGHPHTIQLFEHGFDAPKHPPENTARSVAAWEKAAKTNQGG
jgi:hypothetical protein